MVTQFGMSDKMGNIDYVNEQQTYLGPSANALQAGPETQEKIDTEVRKIVDEGYKTAKDILTKHKSKLDQLANGLLEYETLTGDEITKVMNGLPLAKTEDDNNEDSDGTSSSITSIPKSGKKPPKGGGGGLEPQPQS